MEIIFIGFVALITMAGLSMDRQTKIVEPSITETSRYCEYDDATVRGESIRLEKCWKSIEEKATVRNAN